MSEIDPSAEPGRDEERLSTADLAGASAANPPDAEGRPVASEARSFTPTGATEDQAGPLFASEEADAFRERWNGIQAGFVDEPRRAVELADDLVAKAMKRLAEMFADERDGLERQWDRGDDVSTEDLRQALRRYRSFFTRLLSV
jgi:hypothetical protein